MRVNNSSRYLFSYNDPEYDDNATLDYDYNNDHNRPYYDIIATTNGHELIPLRAPSFDTPSKSADIVPLSTLKTSWIQELDSLKRNRVVQVYYLNTYQGKEHESTNGCTVISSLVAALHLKSEGSGIADITIEKVIDKYSPPILLKLRNKFGLQGPALLIPSDVHDYLTETKVLVQEKFVGVCGGNILDKSHVGKLIEMLENGVDVQPESRDKTETTLNDRKVAATLFFHEHVISILKVVLADGTFWYDLVDSMPSIVDKNQTELAATRTRCKNRASLETFLLWYACEKFSTADVEYIDNNAWEEITCDLDPRVFQGFVWRE
jgi:hypothetical protein